LISNEHHTVPMPLLEAALVTIAFFVSGIVISTLGAMTGLGGGFLAVPYLILLWGQGREEAVLTSFVMIMGNSASSAVNYLRARMVDVKVALFMFVPTVPAIVLGYLLLKRTSSVAFDLSFSILLISVTTYILISRRRPVKDVGGRSRGGIPYLLFPVSFIGGFVSSLFGIGGGAIFMPLQVGYLGSPVKRAVATSMTVIALVSVTRVFGVSGGVFDYQSAIPLLMGALVGGQVGAGLVKRIKALHLLYILCSILIGLALYMGGSAIFQLVA